MEEEKTSTTQVNNSYKLKKQNQKLQQDWIYESNKLKKRYDVIEKQLQSIYRDGNPISFQLKDVFDWNQLMHSNRIKQRNEFQKDLKNISKLVNKFQYLLSNATSNENVLNQMNQIGEEVEDKLMEFKTYQQKQLKELENAEEILWKELCATKERLSTFHDDIKINIDRPQSAISISKHETKFSTKSFNKFGISNDSRPQKLISIQQEIDKYGPYGGWTKRDHDDFLKLYSQIPSDRELLHRLSEIMSHYTLSELRYHLEWFDHYDRLWEQKRLIILKYKQQKQHKKQLKYEYEIKEEERENDLVKKREKNLKIEREKKKKMIEKWKQEKQKKNQETLKLKEERLRKQQLKTQKEYKKRLRESKKLLSELQEKKKLNQLVKKSISIKHINSLKDSERNKKLLLKFRTKDMLIIQKKKNALNKKKIEEKQREWKLVNLIVKSQPDIKVKKDPSRLLKMTAATKKHIEAKKNKNKKNNSRLFACTETATRSVPSWRRGL